MAATTVLSTLEIPSFSNLKPPLQLFHGLGGWNFSQNGEIPVLIPQKGGFYES
jgi:hypothetical protein